NYSDFVWNRGQREGIKKGKAEDLINLMKNFKLNIEEALKGLSIPEAEWDDYRDLVAQLEAHPAQ
ncbi:MAG: hypothetical protein IKY83_14380, partial [Proteobacteria bacterium]|nr:hypothetical protein [Pseudomonadota bacterium]